MLGSVLSTAYERAAPSRYGFLPIICILFLDTFRVNVRKSLQGRSYGRLTLYKLACKLELLNTGSKCHTNLVQFVYKVKNTVIEVLKIYDQASL
jgi:hypothetical protein